MSTATPHPALALAPEVAEALAAGRPVVALESTIISHGMPYPRNVEMAVEVEGIVRDGGATPATIAVLDGIPRIGLDREELETLATHPDVAKVSLRDLPHVMARRAHGATTVASTMRLASLAGIRVFVTGAGDAMLAAWVAAWLRGADPVEAARDGHRAAAATIESPHTVRPDLAEAMAAFGPPTAREVPPC